MTLETINLTAFEPKSIQMFQLRNYFFSLVPMGVIIKIAGSVRVRLVSEVCVSHTQGTRVCMYMYMH